MIETGTLGSVFEAMNDCLADLLASLGISTEEYLALGTHSVEEYRRYEIPFSYAFSTDYTYEYNNSVEFAKDNATRAAYE